MAIPVKVWFNCPDAAYSSLVDSRNCFFLRVSSFTCLTCQPEPLFEPSTDDMGLGKTVMTIALISALLEKSGTQQVSSFRSNHQHGYIAPASKALQPCARAESSPTLPKSCLALSNNRHNDAMLCALRVSGMCPLLGDDGFVNWSDLACTLYLCLQTIFTLLRARRPMLLQPKNYTYGMINQ